MWLASNRWLNNWYCLLISLSVLINSVTVPVSYYITGNPKVSGGVSSPCRSLGYSRHSARCINASLVLIIQTGVSGVGQQMIKPLTYMPGRAGIMVVVCDFKGYDFCSNFCTVDCFIYTWEWQRNVSQTIQENKKSWY